MLQEQFFKNLAVPQGKIDVVLDTDAYNEIDDQFAICYMLKSTEKLNVKGICAAPFFNSRSKNANDGMEKSYDEILHLLDLLDMENVKQNVYKGSTAYLTDENTPCQSDAAEFMSCLANKYSPENPLYIVAIGAITNVASAILKNPAMKENCVVVWLGGHSEFIKNPASEFNMTQDIAAAKVVFKSGVPLVQLPCGGVVDHLTTTKPELEFWLKGKNALCDYLYENTVTEAESYAKGKPWSRVIWDVSAVAWLLNDNNRFMSGRLIRAFVPQYDRLYAQNRDGHFMNYIYSIRRDIIFEDLFKKLAE